VQFHLTFDYFLPLGITKMQGQGSKLFFQTVTFHFVTHVSTQSTSIQSSISFVGISGRSRGGNRP
jgi:hypothetical protein